MNKTKKISSIYLHIPFCEQKCFFCSFVVCVAKKHRINQYLSALNIEMKKYLKKKIQTLYFGGGTPSILNEEQLKKLFDNVYKKFLISKGCEVTFEVNPDSIDFKKAKLLRALGVNRVSVGAQTFNKKYLKFLGRTHAPKDIAEAVFLLRKSGFSNINLDFMYGFPGQTLAQIKEDLKKMTDLETEHLSLYTLTIDPNSQFYRKKIILPKNKKMAKFYVFVSEFLEKRGFYQYEISNFSRKQKQSKHNGVYWEGGNYIGFGVGAHSHLDGKRYWNTSKLYDYILCLKNEKLPIEGSESLSGQDRLMEAILFGLRMNKGVDLNALEKKFHQKISSSKKKMIENFMSDGFFDSEKGIVRTTLKGRLVLDELSARLI